MTSCARPKPWGLLPVLLLCCLCLGSTAFAQTNVRVEVSAQPQRIIWAEDARITLTVSAYDAQGAMVSDGTPVHFYTTLGSLPTIAYTQRGQVTVLLQNTTGPGKAIIDVTVANTRRSVTVEFIGPGSTSTAAAEDRLSYTLQGRQIYFSVDKRLFDLRDQAEFTAPGLRITADALQYETGSGIVTAQHQVVITAGSQTVTGEKMRLDLNARRGFLVGVEPDITFFSFALPALMLEESEEARQADYRPLDPQPTKTWVLCRRATVFPNEMIQFRSPRFYVNTLDHPLLVLPYHVLDLRSSQSGTFFNSEISLTSDAGLNIDFPIYFTATSQQVGSLHLRHVTKGSPFYRGKTGLQISLEEEYRIGNAGDGGLYLDDLTRPTRSVTWDHVHDFGDTRVNVNASYDRYDEEAEYTTRAGLALSRNIRGTSLYLTSHWSRYQGNQDALMELSASLPALTLGKTNLRLGFNPYVGVSYAFAPAEDELPEERETNFYQGLRGDLAFPTLRALGGAFSTNMNAEIAHDQTGEVTTFYDASLRYYRQLSRTFSSSLGYSYGISRSNRDTMSADPSQRLTFDLMGQHGQRWNMFTYASYNLNSESLYASTNFTYYLPWDLSRTGQSRWSFQYGASLSSGSVDTLDHRFTLERNFGAYSLQLHYSPSGNNGTSGIGLGGLGSGTGRQWSLELVRRGW
jgi:lipopolysaccharide export system protein LptA